MASLPNSSKGALARAPLQIPKNASHAWYVVRPIRKALHPRDRRSRRPSFLSVGGHKPRPTSRQTKPTVAPGRAGEVIAPDAVHLVREVVHPVGVEHLPVLPEHLSGLGIDLESYFFADCKPLLLFLCFVSDSRAGVPFILTTRARNQRSHERGGWIPFSSSCRQHVCRPHCGRWRSLAL